MVWTHWTATGVGRKRADRWQDLLGRTMLNVNLAVPDPSEFHCVLSQMSIEGSRLIRFRSSPHRVERSPGDDRTASDRGFVMVSTQLAGVTRTRSGSRHVTLRPGDVGLLDTSRSFTTEFIGPTARAIVLVDKQLMAPAGCRSPIGQIANGDPYFNLVRQHVTTLTDPQIAHDTRTAKQLLHSLSALLARVSTSDSRQGQSSRTITKEDIDSFITLNLSNCALSARMIASQFGVSLRTVFALYAAAGESLEQVIVRSRLEYAAALLSSREHAHDSVMTVSLMCGFKEVSHFSRRFRQAYGMPPSEWRAAARPDRFIAQC